MRMTCLRIPILQQRDRGSARKYDKANSVAHKTASVQSPRPRRIRKRVILIRFNQVFGSPNSNGDPPTGNTPGTPDPQETGCTDNVRPPEPNDRASQCPRERSNSMPIIVPSLCTRPSRSRYPHTKHIRFRGGTHCGYVTRDWQWSNGNPVPSAGVQSGRWTSPLYVVAATLATPCEYWMHAVRSPVRETARFWPPLDEPGINTTWWGVSLPTEFG